MATAAGTRRAGYWGPLALVGLLAAVSGVVLPQMLPDDPPPAPKQAKQSKQDAASTGDLHYVAPEPPDVPSTRALFLRLGGMTVVVLALGIGVLCCGRHWLRGAAPGTAAGGQLRLVETLPLGNRCTLHLVQIASRQVLVGADASGVRTIVPLPDEFEDFLRDPEGPTAPPLAG